MMRMVYSAIRGDDVRRGIYRCGAGSGWVGPHYEKGNWVVGRCVTYYQR